MKLKVRRLELTDAPLARVVKSFAAQEVSLEHMRGFLSNPANYLIVAEAGGEPAGFLLAYALERLKEDARKMFIYELDVAEGFRRKGVGRALINHVRDILKEEKMLSAFVFTNYSNEGAVEFYKNTGGKIVNGHDLLFTYSE
jgi:ribosomal protein S18 acetylase RimI-like enzyme